MKPFFWIIAMILILSACSPTDNTPKPENVQTGTESTGAPAPGTSTWPTLQNTENTGSVGTGTASPQTSEQNAGTGADDPEVQSIMNDLDSIFKDVEGTN